ncbi:amino acid oxidase [Saccharomonospora sp. CUA-673]|nr:amino acid oxidase [Saccharomonospora sp. CUA-673]
MGMTRRTLLRSIGVAGGAGVMFESMRALGLAPAPQALAAPDFQEPREGDLPAHARGSTVVVLGAGIAGLTAAYELGKAGYRCVVLEAKDRIGGRNWTVRAGTTDTDLDGNTQTAQFTDDADTYLNAGPGRIPQSHITVDYCNELGVRLEPLLSSNAAALLHSDGADPQMHRTVKADHHGYVAELLSKAVDAGALDGELTADDKEALLTFLSGFGDIGGSDTGFVYEGSSRRGYAVQPGAADQEGVVLGPTPSLSETLSSGLGRYLQLDLGHDQAMTMLQPVGGMDAIVDALVDAVRGNGAEIITGAPVTELRNTDDGVEITYRGADGDTVLRGDFCIATLPPHLMAELPTNLDPAVADALRTPEIWAAGKLGLEYDRRWWELDEGIYGGITYTDLDLLSMWYPSHGFGREHGVLVGYYNEGPMAEAYGALSPAERTRRALAEGARIHGAQYRRGLRDSFSVAWDRTPHVEGGWAMWSSRGPEYELLNQAAGNVYFAGDWLSYQTAWQAGAMDSARYVVAALHERVATG